MAEPPIESELPVKRLAKELVEVAEVEVELRAVKFWRVVEPVMRRFPPILAKVVFGSNQNSAVVVELEPMTIMSSSLFE